MTDASLKERFDVDGFVVIRQFLDGEALRELQANLARYIRDVVPSLPSSDAFYDDVSRPETLKQMQFLQRDAFFDQYRRNPKWLATAELLLGEKVREVKGVEWFNKPPGGQHLTPPHQDNYYFCLQPPSVLTMWLALDEIDDENGCLRYVRGSHLGGVRPHGQTSTIGFSQGIIGYGDADAEDEVAILAQPGDLLVHHGNTIHRANFNRSATRQRRSFAMVYHGESSQRDEAAYARYLESLKSQHRQHGLT